MKQIYSVYDYPTRQYKYFSAPLGYLPASGGFRAPKTVSGVVIPESVATRVPPDAIQVGTGSEARGLIATLGEVDAGSTAKLFVPLLLTAGLVWWLWRGSKNVAREMSPRRPSRGMRRIHATTARRA